MYPIIGHKYKGRYRVEAPLGRGGMAEVYKVWDEQRSVHLALKLLREDLAQDPVFLRRFQREASSLAKLQHPNIVRFYGLEKDDLQVLLLMDFIEGTTLRELIVRAGKGGLPIARIQEILRDICAALNYAHNQGLLHCDIKAGNILLDKTGKAYLSDFGIARMSDAATATLVGAGTPAYMAPELVKGLEPTPQTDIYALGVVLYEMLTGGERPFTGEGATVTGTTGEKVRWEQVNLPPTPPSRYNPNVSPELEAVVLRCLEKDLSKRFATPLALLEAIQNPSKEKQPEQVKPTAATIQPPKEASGKAELPVHAPQAESSPADVRATGENHAAPVKEATSKPQPSEPNEGQALNRRKNNWMGISLIAFSVIAYLMIFNNIEETQELQAAQTAEAETIAAKNITATAQTFNTLNEMKRLESSATYIDLNPDVINFDLGISNSENSIQCKELDIDFKNFILDTVFFTPKEVNQGWDFVVHFRQNGENDHYRLIFMENGFKLVNWVGGRFDKSIISKSSPLINNEPESRNQIRLAVMNNGGYLFINGNYAGYLNLSLQQSAGLIAFCTGFYSNSGIDGNIIPVRSMRLWELPE